MINLNKLIDEDIFLSYLKNLQGKELVVYCQNYPKHYSGKSHLIKPDVLKRIKIFLTHKFELDESLARIDKMKVKSFDGVEGDYQLFTFHFNDVTPQIFIEKEASEYFREKNVNNLKLSSFYLELLKEEINFKSSKLTDEQFNSLLVRCKTLEAKYAVLFDRFLEFLDEYNLYYDYHSREFVYTLK